MSKNLVTKVIKRYTNYSKIHAEITHEDGAPVISDTTNTTQYTGKGFHYITEMVRAEIISAFMKLQTLIKSHPEQVNPELEIIEDANLALVTKFTRENKPAIVKSLDETIKKIEAQTDFQGIRAYDDNGLTQIISHLFGRYAARCSRIKETTKDETVLINKCIQMLLELKVKGIAKTANYGV